MSGAPPMSLGWGVDLYPWLSMGVNPLSPKQTLVIMRITENIGKPVFLDTAWSVGANPGRVYSRAHEKSIGLAVRG